MRSAFRRSLLVAALIAGMLAGPAALAGRPEPCAGVEATVDLDDDSTTPTVEVRVESVLLIGPATVSVRTTKPVPVPNTRIHEEERTHGQPNHICNEIVERPTL